MGFFKKIFKGIGKVFKKIGRGIKKVVGKVGKFMNKIGIVGQIAMAFILPGIGNALMNGIGGIASSMVTNSLGGIGGALVKGAGHIVSAAHKFVTVGKNAFNTVTQGVTKFIGEFGKTALNKIPGVDIKSASKNFFGKGGAWETVQKDIVKNAGNIANPFRKTVNVREGMDIKDLVNSTGVSRERIQNMNLDLDLDNLKVGDAVNFDAGTLDDVVDPFTRVGSDVGADFRKAAVDSGGAPQDFMNTVNVDKPGQVTGDSLLAPEPLPDTYQEAAVQGRAQEFINAQSSGTVGAPPPPPDPSLAQRIYEGAKDEITGRYDFVDRPLGSTLTAVQDVGTASQLIDPETLEYGGSYNTPMYMGAGSQDMDVMVPTAQRNFQAYSNMGQYGSTSRIYDSILMNPVSTWSRDLSSRFS
jgi:hypothetical protein